MTVTDPSLAWTARPGAGLTSLRMLIWGGLGSPLPRPFWEPPPTLSAISTPCGCKWSKEQTEPRGSLEGVGPRRAAEPPLTLDLVVGGQEADVREGDPAGVSVIELHGDQVPVVLQAQQACGRRGGVRGPKWGRDQLGSSPGAGARGRVRSGQDVGFRARQPREHRLPVRPSTRPCPLIPRPSPDQRRMGLGSPQPHSRALDTEPRALRLEPRAN